MQQPHTINGTKVKANKNKIIFQFIINQYVMIEIKIIFYIELVWSMHKATIR
jgi:hypothetical protein